MKLGIGFIGIIIAGVLGYALEPSIRPALVSTKLSSADPVEEKGGGNPPSQPSSEPETPAAKPEDPMPSAEAVPDWVLTLAPEQLPEKVVLKSKALIPVPGSPDPISLPEGVPVTPVRIDGSFLVFTSLAGPMEGKTPIIATDLVEVLGDEPPAAPPMASNDPVPTQPPADVATPMPEEPAPEPEPETPKRLSDEEIVSVMQQSVKDGQIKEFNFDQVLGWKAAEDKESGGETYQSGLASYKAETIFGVKNIEAQALIKDGKVVKWIWPKSGMEIN